jgi:rsbT co-antagonist protein RsbR
MATPIDEASAPSAPGSPAAPAAAHLPYREAVTDKLLAVLRDVEDGDLDARAAVEVPAKDPLDVLGQGLNFAIEQFGRVRQEAMAYQQAIEEQIQTIEKQREAIRQLSTPVIEVLEGVLCAPIVGLLDSHRANEMSEALVSTVVDKKARLVIIDVTGIDTMDTGTTDHFVRMAKCVRTLGAECVVSGVSPNVAQAIVAMGADTSALRTYRNLRDALQTFAYQGDV